MQQQPYHTDLQNIIDAIDIDREGKLFFNKEHQPGYDDPNASLEAKLFYNLTNVLYSRCYTGNKNLQMPALTPDASANDLFLEKLRKANLSQERFDSGWQVEELEWGGNILVRKGAAKRYTFAGDFLREGFGQGPLQKGEKIKLFNRHEFVDGASQGQGFYYVFGDTLLDFNNDALVRLYFHAKPEGVHKLIALLTENLNEWQVPFQFKCLQQPELYQRADSAVLYFDKRYFSIVMEIIVKHYAEMKPLTNEGIPLFTKELAKGIGFAENPFLPSESFGTNRCNVIAQGIMDGWKQNKPKSEWLGLILDQIEKKFLDPNALYLSPNSKYPYQFPNLNN